MVPISKRCQLSSDALGVLPSSASAMARASAATSPTGTSGPYAPPARISRGPLGQSVETTGAPQYSASIRTVGRPSQRDERANSAARDR